MMVGFDVMLMLVLVLMLVSMLGLRHGRMACTGYLGVSAIMAVLKKSFKPEPDLAQAQKKKKDESGKRYNPRGPSLGLTGTGVLVTTSLP